MVKKFTDVTLENVSEFLDSYEEISNIFDSYVDIIELKIRKFAAVVYPEYENSTWWWDNGFIYIGNGVFSLNYNDRDGDNAEFVVHIEDLLNESNYEKIAYEKLQKKERDQK